MLLSLSRRKNTNCRQEGVVQMEQVRFAVVGLRFGCSIVSQLQGNPFVRVSAVSDLDPAKAGEVASRYKCRISTFEELLADPEIDAVGLFTPPAGRSQLIRKCIESGKAVMTTKPLERDPAAALEILRFARSRGVPVHLNAPSPLPCGELRMIDQWRERYSLGRPVAVRWETYVHYREQPDGRWLDDPELCPVAPVFRLGIYGISELIHLMGRPETVNVFSSRLFTGRPTPDNAELAIRFADGSLGSIFASFCVNDGHSYPSALTVHFQNGTVKKRQYGPAFAVPRAQFDRVELELDCVCDGECIHETCTTSAEERSGAYQWRNFAEAVRSGSPLAGEISPEDVASGIAVIDAMRRAEKSGRPEPVEIPL